MPADIIDIHSHILPGIDDGAADWEESKCMLSLAYEQGIGTIIATPHFSRRQELAYLREQAGRLSEEAKKIDPGFQVYLGQEIQYFESVVEYLKSGRALTLADSRYVLVEFMPDVSWPNLYQWARKIRMAGYWPVIAHVERYQALRKETRMQDLAGAGCYLQMNYRSLDGPFINADARWCRRQIQEGQVDFLATDMHRSKIRSPVISKGLRWLEKHVDGHRRLLLTKKHAERLLAGEPLR